MKHKVYKGKENGRIKKVNKREKESQRNQTDRRTQRKIKARQGLMGHHIKHANWR
jgi:hypothetical protein